MPHITQEQLDENAEVIRRMANTRFGYQHALGLPLERFLPYEVAQNALKAPRERAFDTFNEAYKGAELCFFTA